MREPIVWWIMVSGMEKTILSLIAYNVFAVRYHWLERFKNGAEILYNYIYRIHITTGQNCSFCRNTIKHARDV